MYIKNITIKNVKGLTGVEKFDFGQGVNFFAGNNNTGKSTILEALLFLFEGPSGKKFLPEEFYSYNSEGTSVEADISGEIEEVVNQDKFNILRKYVFEDANGDKILRLARDSRDDTILQGGGKVSIDVKKICFWNPRENKFENATGIDARAKALFDFEAVWADAQPGEYINFSKNKTLGRMLSNLFEDIAKTDSWTELINAHGKVFNGDREGSFLRKTNRLASEIADRVSAQYGNANCEFDFNFPDTSVFTKQGSLMVDDGAGMTAVESKGNGMQRAITLALIQVYAESLHRTSEKDCPLIFMLDEPETWLHPSAQLKLGEALRDIGEHDQVFIATHSPYLIRKFNPRSKRDLLTVISGNGNSRRVETPKDFGVLGDGEPTWAEINYNAFEICSNDFHNELYGFVQRYCKENFNSDRENKINDFLESRGLEKKMIWKRDRNSKKGGNGKNNTTLPVYVRNSIHHPENKLNSTVTEEQLAESTKNLLSVVNWIRHQDS